MDGSVRKGTQRARKLRPWRDIATEQSGNALIEGAIVFPLLISIFLGVSEFSEAFTVSRRLETAATTAADLVARLQTVKTSELTAIKPLIDETIRPFPVASVGLVITSVVADADNNATVAWSHAQGTGVTAYTTGGTVPSLPTGLMLPETSIIVAEIRYTFRSTLTTLIAGDVTMEAEGFQRPRFAVEVVKTD